MFGFSLPEAPKTARDIKNDLITKNVRVLAQGKVIPNLSLANNNDTIIGPPGTGKTTGYVEPNLLCCKDSMVVVDTKGALAKKYTSYMKKRGFMVNKISFVSPEDSMTYNPLDFVRRNADGSYRELDLKRLAFMLVEEEERDRFWSNSTREVIMSLMAFVLEKLDEKSQHFGSVLALFEQMCMEYAENAKTLTSSNEEKRWKGVSFFLKLEEENPNSFAVKMYRMYAATFVADKTWSCIAQYVSNALEPFIYGECAKLFKGRSTFDLANLGRKKSILFLEVSDSDRMMDKMINVFYANLFQTLCDEADRQEDNRLKVPVRVMMDDFGTNVYIPGFPDLISVMRSRDISVSIIIQSISQLHKKYSEHEAATILNNCDHMLYLGGNDVTTAQYIAVKAGSCMDSILNMKLDEAWFFERGSRPEEVEKIDYTFPSEIIKEV